MKKYEIRFILESDKIIFISKAEEFAEELAHLVNTDHIFSSEKFELADVPVVAVD